MREPKLAGYTL